MFAKYKVPAPSVRASLETSEPVDIVSPQRNRIGRMFRVLPWMSLTMTLGVLLAILRQAPALPIQSDPQAADRVAEKMALLQQSIQTNRAAHVALSEAELNQWMRDNLAIASAHQAQQAGLSVPAGSAATVEEVQSALKDVRMNLAGNQLKAYALFHIYRKDISLQLDGTLETRDGYVRLTPTAGKLGALPIPQATLGHVVAQLFESPQNREKFQLPPQISSVHVENSTLVITSR
ncbi:MAG: hypothetical protein Q8N04_19475 [Nitrospira sp.]|nr:hypothetical protein [Nitrospira sp.]